MRKCNKCNELKALNEFYKDNRNKEGRRTICKKCINSKYELVCKECGKEFTSKFEKTMFCSIACKCKRERNSIRFNCELCGIELERPKSQYEKSKHHFCKNCFQEGIKKFNLNDKSHMKNRITFKCDICNKEKEVPLCHYEGHKHHYCSDECQRKGLSKYWNGTNSPQYNPLIDEDARERKRYGVNTRAWREEVYNRDNYICVMCGDNKGGNLNAHHLNSYNWDKENRNNVDNGVTLCDKCHNEFHKKYGFGDNTKEQYEEFIATKYQANTEVTL